MNKYLIFLILVNIVFAVQDITHYGAIPHQDTVTAQIANEKAIRMAIQKANDKQSKQDERIVVIPQRKFYSMPITIENTNNIVIEIRGKITACNRLKHYPKTTDSNKKSTYQHFIRIINCTDIIVRGGGKIDGRGYIWWMNSWLVSKKYMPSGSHRPKLIVIETSKRITVHDIVLKNSPSFHFQTSQVLDSTFYNIDIKVNTTAQLDILKRNYLTGIIPLFPLNTDGIDLGGKNIHIYNITCQNYDDVVVPKPTHSFPNSQTNCTQDMLIQNITVRLGVGLSIGSVPPNQNCNCVKNITFRNSHLQKPLKGIYLKTNPGNSGNGIIDNIVYQNITMYQPIWWAVYLGPQQQKQPDRGGPGCMLYPYDPKKTCGTQPRINISNIVLKNVEIRNSLLFPIVMRCNSTNPCKNVSFQNVNARGWLIGKKDKGFVCQNVNFQGKRSYPEVKCTKVGNNRKLFNIHSLDQDQNVVNEKLILDKLEQASKQVPYIEEDDQMNLSGADILENFLQFKKTVKNLSLSQE